MENTKKQISSRKLISDKKGEMLVAILKNRADFGILMEQGWYRIPVRNAPKRWPPTWIAFYQPQHFKEDAYKVRYFGEVDNIDVLKRKDLFPNEILSERSEHNYYRIRIKHLEELDEPIKSLRWRRIVFITTTLEKFFLSKEINDLYDDSILEDMMWNKLKQLNIQAERQWTVMTKFRYYQLDFALFCTNGQIDLETDGDTWHADKDRIPKDNLRDNDLTSQNWHVLRFNGKQIHEELESYCIEQVVETVNTLGGLKENGIAPRKFYPGKNGINQQLSLFDQQEEYDPTSSDDD